MGRYCMAVVKDKTAANSLKSLQTKLAEARNHLTAIENEQQKLSVEWKKQKKKLDGIQRDIDKLTNAKPVVTEHALLRFAERLLDVDFESIEQLILNDDNLAAIRRLGSGKIPTLAGYTLVVQNNTIVTVE